VTIKPKGIAGQSRNPPKESSLLSIFSSSSAPLPTASPRQRPPTLATILLGVWRVALYDGQVHFIKRDENVDENAKKLHFTKRSAYSKDQSLCKKENVRKLNLFSLQVCF